MRIAIGAAVALAATGVAAEPGWVRVGERAGVVVEQRAVQGSAVREVRATGRSPLPPAAVLETVWNHREYVEFVPYLKRLDVLAEGDDWLVVYEQVALPLASDRDYTIRLTRTAASPGGAFEVRFASVPDAGPPEDGAHVRVRSIAGSWLIEPDPGGGSRAAHTTHDDPGGELPAWLVNRVAVPVTARFVAAMLARAEARRPSERR